MYWPFVLMHIELEILTGFILEFSSHMNMVYCMPNILNIKKWEQKQKQEQKQEQEYEQDHDQEQKQEQNLE